eukprot:7765691-Heterocapsa_arctica.AAC.1
MDFGPDFMAESAPSPVEGRSPHEPDIELYLGPAEEVCGHLATCEIDFDGREAVLGEMQVVMGSDLGLDEWFRIAVET